ncbi:LysR family transcriptional regulator [Actinomadura sp. HBU206391]|uniref:LysR family transcriptional regulator n=1 Tax=Actinomadura sp. HBU206391 TaxID=2731692 RepID=UPI00164F9C49|nr:LysR family transcriptional regulator [Actinomadura sp. HBU206391]MBC6462327.1 LysR family transcriptional regulator [Actinomadura sp. HBU206391]
MLDVTRLRVLVAVARTGSVTGAARELHYSQPSVSHHLARLEAETGAGLVQRVGRGIRLTEAGRLLADRGAEILGRLDAASSELAAHVGLRQGRVRLAAFPSALGTFVPAAAARLAADHPGLDLRLVETETPQAVRMLRDGTVDAAVIFRYDGDGGRQHDVEMEDGIRTRPLLEESTYLVTPADPPPHARAAAVDGRPGLAAHRDSEWIAGCDRCRAHLLDICAEAGFQPHVSYTTDDYVAVQALVAAGLGVTTLPHLALSAARNPGVRAVRLPGSVRYVLAATYGEPPDPPATAALLDALVVAASAGTPGATAVPVSP